VRASRASASDLASNIGSLHIVEQPEAMALRGMLSYFAEAASWAKVILPCAWISAMPSGPSDPEPDRNYADSLASFLVGQRSHEMVNRHVQPARLFLEGLRNYGPGLVRVSDGPVLAQPQDRSTETRDIERSHLNWSDGSDAHVGNKTKTSAGEPVHSLAFTP
jgi:hypothetical protein